MAKPSPLPIGKPTRHVLQSRGAEPDLLNFYSTSYSTGFTRPSIENNKGRHFDIPAYSGKEVFKPRTAPENRRTGYTTNVRPQIYYRRTLDDLDNPEMGRSCTENYDTTTELHFQPYKTPNGNEELPVQVLGQTSSYTQTAYNHHTRPSEIHDQFIDTRIRAPYDVIPEHRTKLDKLNNKDPIRNENFGHGPNYMSTEQGTRYKGTQRPDVPDLNVGRKVTNVGPKELSGFVENKLYEDAITAYPGERWNNHYRPIGTTVHKDKYLPYSFCRSETQLPNISNLAATKHSTYVKTFQPSDINPRHHRFTDTTETKDEYPRKNLQRKPTLVSEKLGTAHIGHVNETAQTLCESGFVQTLDDARRFNSSYQINHYDMNAKGKDREGMVTGGIYGPLEDGYSTNVKTHNTGNVYPRATLNNMDSFQSRSIRGTDRFYDDTTHNHKLTFKNNNVVAY